MQQLFMQTTAEDNTCIYVYSNQIFRSPTCTTLPFEAPPTNVPGCMCHGRKRNCLLRLHYSMMSMSVTNTAPSGLVPIPIIANFFRISQPIAPAPTCEGVIVCGCEGVRV